MADFSQLIADVQAVIRENGRQLITGPVLQSTLIEIINTINADKQDPLNIVDALIAGSTDPVTSGAVEAAVSGLGIDLANEVNARIAADALLIPKADIVQTTGSSLSSVMSQKAVTDAIGDIPQDVFVAKGFGDTTFAQVLAAKNAGKAVIAVTPAGDVYTLIGTVLSDGSFGFYTVQGSTTRYILLRPNNTWGGPSLIQMQREANMEQSVSSSTTKYPSSKAVNDALAGKQATISDLDAIRAGALLGSTAYQLPVGGIPFEDLEQSVQLDLEKAGNSLQPNTDYDGQIPVYNEEGYIEGAGITPDDLAQKDGTYPDLTAGAVLGAPVPAEFAYRGAPYGGSAVVDTVLGNSVKWNQLCKNDASFVFDEATFNNGIYTCTPTSGAYVLKDASIQTGDGHKFYWAFTCKKDVAATVDISVWGGDYLSSQNIGSDWGRRSYIISNDGANEFGFSSGAGLDFSIKDILIVDLTAIFGSGSEPSTVSAFEAWMVQQGFAGLTDYNPGQVLGNAAKNLKTAGFQLWDEVWEVGSISNYTGQDSVSPNTIRSTNYSPCVPGATYCLHAGGGGGIFIYWYDANKDFISFANSNANDNDTATAPSNAAYFRLRGYDPDYGPVYHHDICINISGPRNGQYEPYVGAIDTIALNLSTLTGIPEGGGSSEVVFPLGLQRIGGVSDWGKGSQAMRKFEVVDLGDLSWDKASYGGHDFFYTTAVVPGIKTYGNDPSVVYPTACCSKYNIIKRNDVYNGVNGMAIDGATGVYLYVFDASLESGTAAQFKSAVSGVKLVAELATPIEYTLDQPLPALYETAEGGPEYIEGPAGTAPTTAPFVGEIRYSQPQADANGLAVAILDALKAASKITSYTFGIDPETSKPAITIS